MPTIEQLLVRVEADTQQLRLAMQQGERPEVGLSIVDLEQAKAWLKRRAAEPAPAEGSKQPEARH